MVHHQSVTLSREQILEFRSTGLLGPFDLLSTSEVQAVKQRVRQEVARPGPHREPEAFRHLDCPSVWQLCARPAIVGRIAQLLGPDLVLWRTHLFDKPPLEPKREFPWHQDASNWPIAPGNTVTAWIALDDATRESGCMEMLPGQNSRIIDQREVTGFERFRYQTDITQLDLTQSRHVEVRAGQFVLFDDHLPHRSGGNNTPVERLAIAMRVTRPTVPIQKDRLFEEFRVLLLSGSHEHGVNPLGQPPIGVKTR